MKALKMIFAVLLIILTSLSVYYLLSSQGVIKMKFTYEDIKQQDSNCPEGFMPFAAALKRVERVLKFVPWETQLAFIDTSGLTISQKGIYDESFIIKHNDTSYVNEEMFSVIVERAVNTYQQRKMSVIKPIIFALLVILVGLGILILFLKKR